ncbi:MAG: hypothetical protein AABY64_02375 [Bdellovibrionota bacterium]
MRAEKLTFKVILQIFLVVSTLFFPQDLFLESEPSPIHTHEASFFTSSSDSETHGSLCGDEDCISESENGEYLDERSFLLLAKNLKSIAFNLDDFYLGNFFSCLFKPPCLA